MLHRQWPVPVRRWVCRGGVQLAGGSVYGAWPLVGVRGPYGALWGKDGLELSTARVARGALQGALEADEVQRDVAANEGAAREFEVDGAW